MIYPDFFYDFNCIADKCRHTCCKGWEIDIDDDTADYYLNMPGKLGERIRRSIEKHDGNEGYSFILTEDERCPMLRPDGLCDIILEEGDDLLCDICALHPRFYEEINGLSLAGLGLSCEAVCDLLLEKEKPVMFIEEEEEESSSANEERLSFEELLNRLSIKSTFPDYSPKISNERLSFTLNVMEKTEPINDEWTAHLEAMKSASDEIIIESGKPIDQVKLNNVYTYIFYRQLERITEYGIKSLTEYARLCTDFIYYDSLFTGDLPEAVRCFSEQIEYSTENVDILTHNQTWPEPYLS